MQSLIFQLSLLSLAALAAADGKSDCQFAHRYSCEDFSREDAAQAYLQQVMRWESNFASPGVGYDAATGYCYDGHPLDYNTAELYGEPHLFSAPSKESIHVSLLALAVSGDPLALRFSGGLSAALDVLELKMAGYQQFNASYPAYGCFTPWVGFSGGVFSPLDSWSQPYFKVPGLDNGEWFWALFAASDALHRAHLAAEEGPLKTRLQSLAQQYSQWVDCQKHSAKAIFYRGAGDVSATVYILNVSAPVTPDNYLHCDGYLNDPYEGETMTLLLDLFADWPSEEGGAQQREQLWEKKRAMLQRVDYTAPGLNSAITVQRGYWFSTHEQWKTLLLPYLSADLPLLQQLFRNCEKARTWDAAESGLPGLLASINDVTDGSQDIPDYASACGAAQLAFEPVERRDLATPYASFALFLHDRQAALCWYNNMLRGPRMQSRFGSTEALNMNATEISPLTTWDSKITTVLGMLGGVGAQVGDALKKQRDVQHGSMYDRFVHVIGREYALVFGSVAELKGTDAPFRMPPAPFPQDALKDWQPQC